MDALRIVVADAREATCQALRLILDLEPGLRVVATATDGPAAIRAIERHRPDVALLDRDLPLLDGLATARDVAARCPEVAVILLATFHTDAERLAARAAGARDYLLKGLESEELVRAVRMVAAPRPSAPADELRT